MADLRDFSRLDIRDGMIHYRLYQQDGSLAPMTARDMPDNRLFVSWVQIHDRYSGFGEHEPAAAWSGILSFGA